MNHFADCRPPPPNVHIPWGWYSFWGGGPTTTVVNLYAEAGKRGRKEPEKQVYGKRANRKWAVS